MLRPLSLATVLVASVLVGSSPAYAEDGVEISEVLALDVTARARLLEDWRAEAKRRLSASSADLEASCRRMRRDQARRLLDVLDAVSPTLTDPKASSAQQETATAVVVRAWTPVEAVELHTPCTAPDPSEGMVDVSLPEARDDHGLFDAAEDDPMTLGPDLSGRRALRL